MGCEIPRLSACSKAPGAPAMGTARLQLTDAPADFESVNLVIDEVGIHQTGAGADSTSGWLVLTSTPKTYDLLSLRNGVFSTIGMSTVPAGHYTQVRLKLGAGSNPVGGGVTYPLTVPNGMRTRITLVSRFDVPAT